MIASGGVASERFCWRVEAVLGLRGAVVVRALIVVSSRVCRAPDSWFLMSRRAVKNSEIGAPGLGTISLKRMNRAVHCISVPIWLEHCFKIAHISAGSYVVLTYGRMLTEVEL